MIQSATMPPVSTDSAEGRLHPRTIAKLMVLALAVRAAYLGYNLLMVNLPPLWGVTARAGISYSAGARTELLLAMDRGILVLYWLMDRLAGPVAHWKIQVLQNIVDMAMVMPVILIAGYLAGRRAALAAGLAYALFLPQIFLASFPGYESWFSFLLLLSAWLFLKLSEARGCKLLILALAWVGLLIIGVQFRSILVLLGFGGAGWLLVTELVTRRQLDHWVLARIGLCLLVGIITIWSSIAVNTAVRGEASPVRGTLGHSFWAGVGQYDNPFGLKDDDASVAAFYERETGLVAKDYDQGYNAWLVKRAITFVREQPGLYASMALRRGLSILVPNMPVLLVADNPALMASEQEQAMVALRRSLRDKEGVASPRFWLTLAGTDPGYLINIGLRGLLMVLLPLGVLAALVLGPRRQVLPALLPLAYITITLSPYYVSPVVIASTQAAILPAAVAGLVLLAVRIRGRSP